MMSIYIDADAYFDEIVDAKSVMECIAKLHSMPAAVPAVTRCSECIHWEQNEQNDDGICEWLHRRTTPGWYCAYGEDRK